MQNRGSEFISIFAVLSCKTVNYIFKNSSEIPTKKWHRKKKVVNVKRNLSKTKINNIAREKKNLFFLKVS